MKFSFKKHGEVLAICDADLLGKTFSEGDLNIHVSRQFYGGGPADEAKLAELLKSSRNINIIGTKIVAFAKKNGLIESTKKINNIPYSFIFRL